METSNERPTADEMFKKYQNLKDGPRTFVGNPPADEVGRDYDNEGLMSAPGPKSTDG